MKKKQSQCQAGILALSILLVLLMVMVEEVSALAALQIKDGEQFDLPGGRHVYKTVHIGSNAKIALSSDTEIMVVGDGVTDPAFYMGQGAVIYAGAVCPYAGNLDGRDGENGMEGDEGVWDVTHFTPEPPFNPPPVYTPPTHMHGSNGASGSDAGSRGGVGRFPNLEIRVEGNMVLAQKSEILLSAYRDGVSLNPSGGRGGDGGNGGNGGNFQVFRTSGIMYEMIPNIGGNGGDGGAGGNGTDGAPGIDGGTLRIYVNGILELEGEVTIDANGSMGGSGGRAGNGGFPGDYHWGLTEDGEYGAFGANGTAGKASRGGNGGSIDIYSAWSLSAHPPYNIISAANGRGGGGGTGSDSGFKYYGGAGHTQKTPALTAPGEAGDAGDPGSIRIRVGGFLGTSPLNEENGAWSTDCYLLCATLGGNGGEGGSLGHNWSVTDDGFGTQSFPGNGKNGGQGGHGGFIEIESANGIYGHALYAAAVGGKGGVGGHGGTVPSDGFESFYVSGGNGGNGGNGGEVIFRAPTIEFQDDGGGSAGAGKGAAGGNGTSYGNLVYGESGPKGLNGTDGTIGRVTLEYLVNIFPMTLKIETVPADLAGAAAGDVVQYRCTFTNASGHGIQNFVLQSDVISSYGIAVQNSAAPLGTWNSTGGYFKTAPCLLASGESVSWDFSVVVGSSYPAGAELINGVTAQGLFGGKNNIDHVMHSLPLNEAPTNLTIDDARTILQVIACEPTQIDLGHFDIDGDGRIDVPDIVGLLQCLAGNRLCP